MDMNFLIGTLTFFYTLSMAHSPWADMHRLIPLDTFLPGLSDGDGVVSDFDAKRCGSP